MILRAFFARSPDGSTVLFCYYLLEGNTAAPSGLFARLFHAFLVSSFFNSTQIISRYTGPIFTIVSPNERYLHEFSQSGPLFDSFRQILDKFWTKFAKWPLFNTLVFHNGFEYRNSVLEVVKGTIFATFCAIMVKIGPLTPKITQQVSVPFGMRRQKSINQSIVDYYRHDKMQANNIIKWKKC